MRRVAASAVILASLALSPAGALAGEVAGTVLDQVTGQPLRGALVSVPGTRARTFTDDGGRFRLFDVPAGNRSLEVSFVGYETLTAQVSVPETGVVVRDLTLEGVATSETLVVTGFRASQAQALQAKKYADVIKDSVTSDDVRRLPDHNAAEALQRVPGVSITIDQGEGRYVTVRGMDPGLNNVTINGQTVGAPEGDTRRVALDTIPSALLSRLEVVKSVTPDMDATAVGGAINLVTPSAFDDPDGRYFSASVDTGYYELNSESPWGASVAWGQVFGPEDQFGVMLSGSYSEREYASENVQGNTWEEEGDFFIPEEQVLRDYSLERVRKGLVANLEWRPNSRTEIYWHNLYNVFEDTERRLQTVYDYINGDLLDQTPTSGTFTEGEGERLAKDRLEEQSILNSTIGGNFMLGDRWTVDAALTLGKAEQDTPFDNEWSFELADPLPTSYDTSSFFFTVDAGDGFHDADAYEFNEVERARQIVEEDLTVGRVDFERETWFADNPGYIKFGAKFTSREKTSDQDGEVYDGFDGDLLLTQVSRPGKSDFYCSERCYTFGPAINYGAAERFFSANRGAFELSEDDSRELSFESDYEVSEDVTAGYLMAGVELGSLSLVGGIRGERTDADYEAYDIVFEDGDLAPEIPRVRGSNDYTNWLPGLQARWAWRDDVIVRGAWTNTIGRAAYENLVPFRVFEVDPVDDVAFEGSVEEGNPELDPIESANLDASFEWYLQPAGILAVAVFYKDIDNPIYTRVRELEDADYQGRFFTELEIVRPENADKADLFGVELNYQQQFRALPSPFDGFGLSVNYTWTDSEAEAFDRDDKVPLFLQSDQVGNVAVFYEKFGFEARIALAYRSEYLDALGDDPQTDIYVDSREQVDFKASYRFDSGLSLFVEMLNITDEPLRYYSGNSSRLAENEIYSWNARAGIHYTFQ